MENNNSNGQNGQNNQQPKRRGPVRGIIITLLAIVAVVILFWAFSSGPRGTEVGYNVFINELNTDHIERVEFENNRVNYQTKDGSWYWFYNRSTFEISALDALNEYNARINAGTKDGTTVLIVPGTSSTFNFLSLLYPILLIVVLIMTVFVIMRQIRGMNNRSMEFVKNRARVASSKVRFDKVAGADEEKAELEEIIQFLKDPEKFTRVGARIPKGVLLVGPPGTGKTLLAKAVAGEANVPFFTISGSDFMELYVGVGASRVRDLFENAKLAKPCIVFIDEIDAVGRQRGTGLGGGNDEREQTLNQLLVQMDGFEPNEGIIVMAATNRADILDPALTRPGRFDRQIYISSPDIKGREEILRVHAEGKPLGSDVQLKEVARITSGFTGADLENLLNEAAILAARANRKTITMEDLNNAIVKVTIGPQKRSRVVSDEDKKITAYHESGHAVVEKCCKHGEVVHEISIIQRGGAGGYTLTRPENDESYYSKQKLLDRIAILLGGRCSEELNLSDITTGASNDISHATELARRMVTDWGMSDGLGLVHHGESSEVFLGRDYQTRVNYSEQEASKIDAEVKKIIDSCYEKAKAILKAHKKEVETMVQVLLEKETIYADEVDMIMKGASVKEVVDAIEQRIKSKKAQENSKKEEENQEKKEPQAEVKEESKVTASDYIDNLFKEAEKRLNEKQLESENKDSDEAEKPVDAGKDENVSRETISSAPKKTAARKPRATAGKSQTKTASKTSETKKAKSTKTTKSTKKVTDTNSTDEGK